MGDDTVSAPVRVSGREGCRPQRPGIAFCSGSCAGGEKRTAWLVAALERTPTAGWPGGRALSDAIRRLKALEQRKVRIDQALRGPADIQLAKLAGELKETRKNLEGPRWPIVHISRSGALRSSGTQAQYLCRTAQRAFSLTSRITQRDARTGCGRSGPPPCRRAEPQPVDPALTFRALAA